MALFIVGSSDNIYQALYDAGVVTEDPKTVSRVIIDLECGSPAKVYIQKFLDNKIIDVVLAGGIQIVEKDVA